MLAISSEDRNLHVIFFDDGHAQKIISKDIRLVLESNCLDHGEFISILQFDRNMERV